MYTVGKNLCIRRSKVSTDTIHWWMSLLSFRKHTATCWGDHLCWWWSCAYICEAVLPRKRQLLCVSQSGRGRGRRRSHEQRHHHHTGQPLFNLLHSPAQGSWITRASTEAHTWLLGLSPPSQDPTQATTFFLRAKSGVRISDNNIHGLKFQLEHTPTDCHLVNVTTHNNTAAVNETAAASSMVKRASSQRSSEGVELDTGAVRCSPLRVKAKKVACDNACDYNLFVTDQEQGGTASIITAIVVPPHEFHLSDYTQYYRSWHRVVFFKIVMILIMCS